MVLGLIMIAKKKFFLTHSRGSEPFFEVEHDLL